MKRQKLMGAVLALLASLGLVACEATTYGYVPVASAADTDNGEVAAEYSVPRSTPHGRIRVDSLGVTAAKESGAPNALHVRMTITNDDDKDWTIDTQKQQIKVNGQTLKASTVATDASSAASGTITIPANSTRSVDLFFALPADVSTAENVPSFDADWQVNVGDNTETGATSFTRTVIEPEPQYDSGYDEYGYSPYWYSYPGYYDVGLTYWPPGYYYPYYYPYYGHRFHDHDDHEHYHSGYYHRGSAYSGYHGGGHHGGSYASRGSHNGYRTGGYRSGSYQGGGYHGGYHGGGYHGGAYQGGYHGGGTYHGGGGFHGGGAYHGGGGFHGGGAYHGGGGFHGGGFHGGGFSGGGFHGGGFSGGGHGGGHR
jgi:hypothetical protein